MRALLFSTALLASSIVAAQSAPSVSGPPQATPTAPTAIEPVVASTDDATVLAAAAAARVSLKAASEANTAGDGAAAGRLWRQALAEAPLGRDGDAIAAEATRRLGFLAFEARDPRGAEQWLRAEAALSRRLYALGALPARRYAEALNRLASAAGSNGRNVESAALLTLAQDIKTRAQAAVSAAVMGREGVDLAAQQSVRITQGDAVCVTDDVPDLARRLTCADEEEVTNDAMIAHSQRVKAEAPPPEPIKSEKGRGKGR